MSDEYQLTIKERLALETLIQYDWKVERIGGLIRVYSPEMVEPETVEPESKQYISKEVSSDTNER